MPTVAEKVTAVPEQTGPVGFAAMEMVGVNTGLTAIVTTFDVELLTVRQVAPVTVIVQLILSPLFSALVTKLFELLL